VAFRHAPRKLTGGCADPDNRRAPEEKLALRIAALALGIILLAVTGANGQVNDDPVLLDQLKKLFPTAASFSAKSGTPAAYRADPRIRAAGELLGRCWFWARAARARFDGPIKMLVGMDTNCAHGRDRHRSS
jgi:transcriptional regulator of nitric oxide reductase